MKTINGQEASLLALLAQSVGSDISEEETNKILSKLTGDVKLIGKAIIGKYNKNMKAEHFKAAYGFVDWALKMRGL
jgi:hypothetical protein